MRRFLLALTFLLMVVPGAGAWQPRQGRDLVGQPAPEFANLHWLTSPPLSMQALRGKVVLIRFWLRGCPLCAATAPVLNDFYRTYVRDGLVVIGIHHPKSPEARDETYVRDGAKALGFTFPVAMDNDWITLRRFWLNGPDRDFTSATFLIDRQGIIRWLHDGGELHPGPDREAREANESCRQTLLRLLREAP